MEFVHICLFLAQLMMPLEDYKAFLAMCKDAGALSAKMGEFEVTFEPQMVAYEYAEAEEEADEDEPDPMFYSAEQ